MDQVGSRAALASLLALSACASGPRDDFERDVLPIIEQRCLTAACHGVAPGDVFPDTPGLFVRIEASGRAADVDEAREAVLSRVTGEAPRGSTLLRVPMPAWAGGGPHAGGAAYSGPDEPAVRTILDWIAREERGGEDVELTPLERQFADDVAPVLAERCARENCHGPRDVAFSAFGLHVDPVDGTMNPRDIPGARLAVRQHLDLWSADPRRSRLIRKAIGEAAGGLPHRGGAGTLFPEADPTRPLDVAGIRAILAWARAEREAIGATDEVEASALIWVEGPDAPRVPYRIEPGPVGSDLWIAPWPSLEAPRNLTAALHPGEDVEIRDPALSHDATRIAFAMRRDDGATFALWELVLESGEARELVAGPGSFVEPTHAADGRWIAVWDGHGEVSSDGEGVAPELVAISEDGFLERLTYTPAPEVSPAFLAAGKTRGGLVFGTRRTGPHGAEGVLFRFPLCHDPAFHGEPEYHVQHGASAAPWAPRVARDLADGRQIVIALGDASAPDDRGALLILDRSLGPTLLGGSTSSVGGFVDPLTWIDESPRYRDPAPLPDGRVILVSGDELVLLDLGPIVTIEPLLRVAGAALRSPVPVFARPDEDDGHAPITDRTAAFGYLALRDVAVLEAIFGRAEPRGPRPLRDDIAALRLLAADGRPAAELARVGGTTTVGASAQIPTRILVEAPLAADRSIWLRVPARTPFLVQLLDARGMIVGRQLDRWYFAEGEETLPGGTNAETYRHACAGCHGSTTGDPEDAVAPAPDSISSASVNLSTHEARDRRRPLEPRPTDAEPARVDYVNTIAPLLAERCGECHGEGSTVPLRSADAYETLCRHVDLVGLRARRSPLVERLLGEDLEAPGTPGRRCPPDADPELVGAFVRWIEAGAFEDLDRRAP